MTRDPRLDPSRHETTFGTPTIWPLGAVEFEPENSGWLEMTRSDLVEWRSDGHMYINGVDQGAHDVP